MFVPDVPTPGWLNGFRIHANGLLEVGRTINTLGAKCTEFSANPNTAGVHQPSALITASTQLLSSFVCTYNDLVLCPLGCVSQRV